MTITEFLTARLDEWEHALRDEEELFGSRLIIRILRDDIAAKRLIIGWHSDNPHECEGPLGCEYVPDDDSKPCSTMCALTLPYADHADFDPEWKL